MRRIRDRLFDLAAHPAIDRLRRWAHRQGLWAVPHFLEESARSLWRTRLWTAFAVALIGLSLATIGAFLVVAENLAGLVARIESLEVSVYLSDVAQPEEIAAARAALAARPDVIRIEAVSKEEAFDRFRKTSPELARLARELGDNPLPASLEVTLAPAARTPAGIDAFARAAASLPGVESVSRDLELAERAIAASRLARLAAVFLGGVLLLSALFTVSNVVKLTVYARRDEVEILRLVGATGGYVRGLFVTDGVLQGLLGGALALALLLSLHRGLTGWIAASGLPLLAALTGRFLSGAATWGLLVAAVMLGAAGGWLPLRRIGRA